MYGAGGDAKLVVVVKVKCTAIDDPPTGEEGDKGFRYSPGQRQKECASPRRVNNSQKDFRWLSMEHASVSRHKDRLRKKYEPQIPHRLKKRMLKKSEKQTPRGLSPLGVT